MTMPPDVCSAAVVAPRELAARDGRYLLRPLGPADAARLQEFFYSHTFDTIQMRYGHAVSRMTDERALDLVGVDQSRDAAIAIFETIGGRLVIHAVGRYYLDADGRAAEVAFVVRESKRRLGFATLLLQTLVNLARARGLAALWGRVRRDNAPMLALFRRFGGEPMASAHPDHHDVDMRIGLHAPAPPASPGAAKIPRPPQRRLSRLRKMAAKRRPHRPSTR